MPGGSIYPTDDQEVRVLIPTHWAIIEIDNEIFSTVILSLPLFQDEQLSVSGERLCTSTGYRLED